MAHHSDGRWGIPSRCVSGHLSDGRFHGQCNTCRGFPPMSSDIPALRYAPSRRDLSHWRSAAQVPCADDDHNLKPSVRNNLHIRPQAHCDPEAPRHKQTNCRMERQAALLSQLSGLLPHPRNRWPWHRKRHPPGRNEPLCVWQCHNGILAPPWQVTHWQTAYNIFGSQDSRYSHPEELLKPTMCIVCGHCNQQQAADRWNDIIFRGHLQPLPYHRWRHLHRMPCG